MEADGFTDAQFPIRMEMRIADDEVTITTADDLWGLDAMDTLEALSDRYGKRVRSLAIGPAGENLSYIATIQTSSGNACGQGGFGAVMGAKNLKAISGALWDAIKALFESAKQH